MKGDTCGFLHQFDPNKMPVCRNLLKFGVCKEPDCPYKHTTEEIKECNMYKLGFCIYGPAVSKLAHTHTLNYAFIYQPGKLTYVFIVYLINAVSIQAYASGRPPARA